RSLQVVSARERPRDGSCRPWRPAPFRREAHRRVSGHPGHKSRFNRQDQREDSRSPAKERCAPQVRRIGAPGASHENHLARCLGSRKRGQRTPVAAASTPRARGSNPELSERSEEHTSELQSPCNLVCRLLLEKKNK